MTAEAAPATAAGGPARREPRHGWRIGIVWLVLAAVATPIVYFVWGPHLPPGRMSDQAKAQQFDIQVLAALATPVVLAVWVYAGYALIFFRERRYREDVEPVDAVPLRGHAGLQAIWILVTTVIVLFAFVFGTYELINPNGAGAGEGPSPIWRPAAASAKTMVVLQVIGQQWRWTYRWPQYGGIETTALELPLDQQVEVNVTSLDVIHSWWAIQLGVKADANPSVNNVAFVEPERLGHFVVRCAELCGIWHADMITDGYVVTPAQFAAWINQQRVAEKSLLPYLPKYATTYNPDECPGADGSYYPGSDPLPSPAPGACGK